MKFIFPFVILKIIPNNQSSHAPPCSLSVEPAQISMEHPDVVPALPGETITIPCYVHYPPGTGERLQSVTWRKGSSPLCRSYSQTLNTQDAVGHFSVVNSPTDVSLQINKVQREDSGYYCCIVGTSRGENHIISSTELVVEGNEHSEIRGL